MKWSSNPRYTEAQAKFIFVFIIVVLTLYTTCFAGLWNGWWLPDEILPVHVQLSRAGRVIVVRFPEKAGIRQEEVLIHYHPDIPVYISRVFVAKYGEKQRGNSMDISAPQWEAWNALRTEWCLHPPSNTTIPQPAFQIGVICPANIAAPKSMPIFWIAPDALPSELRALLQEIPSPGCDDALCGW